MISGNRGGDGGHEKADSDGEAEDDAYHDKYRRRFNDCNSCPALVGESGPSQGGHHPEAHKQSPWSCTKERPAL